MNATALSHWDALVRARPDALALVEAASGREWTRADLDRAATEWSAALPSGLNGHRITFALPNGSAWFAAFIGLLRAGAVPVPLDPSEPPAAQLALATAAHAPFAWLNARLTPTQCNPLGDTSLDSPSKPKPKCNLIGYTSSGEFLVKLTSGSTGQPKALAFTDAQLLADARQVCASMDIRPDDVNFAVIPFGHSYGLGNLVMPLLAQGTPIICAGVPLPHALAADLARWRPTVFPAVPALLRALAQSDLPPPALGSLRTVISAGSPLSSEIARVFFEKFGLRPHGFYGSSETGGITYDRDGEATLAGRSVGTPLDGVTLTPLADGRIEVSSPAVVSPGVFQPADLASLNAHGELVLHGRSGRLVKISGRRLDLGDLERLLRALPGIDDAFVALHPHNPDALAAVVATALTPESVRTLLTHELAAWKIPRRIVPVTTFPLTARGKPDTVALTRLLER